MMFEYQLKALEGVLTKGTKITLSEILDIVKTITGIDLLDTNQIETLYNNGKLLVGEDYAHLISVEYYTDSTKHWDNKNEPLVQIRHVHHA